MASLGKSGASVGGSNAWVRRTISPSVDFWAIAVVCEQGSLGDSNACVSAVGGILAVVYQGQMVLLHGFIKKTQQTPEEELDLAVKRQKEVESGKTAK
jgi:hypothetical protein